MSLGLRELWVDLAFGGFKVLGYSVGDPAARKANLPESCWL